jgi:hypothetical protein
MSNPLPPPPKLIISEIYFNNTDWTIEMVVGEPLDMLSDNLDSVIIESSSGEAYFKSGIQVEPGQIILITKDSLKTPLTINRTGDFINLKEYQNGYLNWDLIYIQDISFGNYLGASCSSPYDGQSLVSQYFHVNTPDGDNSFYWLVKESTPTLGSSPNACNSRDTLKGYLIDKFEKPIKNGKIEYINDYRSTILGLPTIITDDTGYFEAKGMFAKNYSGIVVVGDSTVADVSFKVELDSANRYIFKFYDYVFTGLNYIEPNKSFSITNYPNPSIDQTTFEIVLPENLFYKNAIIKIYNNAGKIIDILPVDEQYNNSNHFTMNWTSRENIPAGDYYYCLEIDNKKLATNKMILIK